ncbi:MAG: hypothetical protein RIG68_14220 [Imperialibacter sp.]|uniref:hypothetical protein n=1 Tax=Imperialibacter sp. TaxID=2038411 RepID=UPI0032EF0746
MNNNKIRNNESYSQLREQINAADSVRKLARILSFFGIKNKNLNEVLDQVPDFKKQLEHLSSLPDEFNQYFSELGWIAHESMNTDLMEKAVDLAESGDVSAAEDELTEYFCSDKIDWLLHQFKGIPEFNIRFDLLKSAFEDTKSERYHSCIPILLMIIDGTVNDIDRNKGFFTESTDLSAWDSIAGHSSGLSKIRDILNQTRKKTTTETLRLPYRNGILHGRDLGYANKVVAAKCWAILIAIKDWVKAIKDGKKNPPPPKEKKSFREEIKSLSEALNEYSESKKRNEEISKQVEQWSPRSIQIGVDVPFSGEISDFQELTPEREAVQFLHFWKTKNYGGIAKQIHRFSKKELVISTEAGKLRGILSDKQLIDFSIKEIDDKSPAISEVTIHLNYSLNLRVMSKDITLRFICQGKDGRVGIFGDPHSKWEFIDHVLYTLDFE